MCRDLSECRNKLLEITEVCKVLLGETTVRESLGRDHRTGSDYLEVSAEVALYPAEGYPLDLHSEPVWQGNHVLTARSRGEAFRALLERVQSFVPEWRRTFLQDEELASWVGLKARTLKSFHLWDQAKILAMQNLWRERDLQVSAPPSEAHIHAQRVAEAEARAHALGWSTKEGPLATNSGAIHLWCQRPQAIGTVLDILEHKPYKLLLRSAEGHERWVHRHFFFSGYYQGNSREITPDPYLELIRD